VHFAMPSFSGVNNWEAGLSEDFPNLFLIFVLSYVLFWGKSFSKFAAT
jgi:hypothetical protein